MYLQRDKRKMHKHVLALFMTLVMVLTMSGFNGGTAYVNAAAVDEITGQGENGSSIITMGTIAWTDALKESYTFPNANVSFTEDQLIFSISVDNGGYFVVPDVDLGTKRTLTGVKYDSSKTSYTGNIQPGDKLISMTFTGTTPAAKIKEYLQSIVFYRNGVAESEKQKISVVANQIHLDDGMCAVAIDGKLHYYEYVTPNEEEGESLLDWFAAYKAAKTRAFNGMHGYLATITMDAEQKYIFAYYDDIGHQEMWAWIGGLKTKLTNFTAANWDASELDSNLIDLGQRGSTTDLVATDWYWACGPEAGQTFYITNDEGKSSGAPGSDAADIQYNGWASGEPDNAWTSDAMSGGEDHPTHQEYVTEYGYAEEGAWNDYGAFNKNINLMKGYIVEYSPYKNDEAHGGQKEEEDKESSSVVTIVTADDTIATALKEARLSTDKVKVGQTIYVNLVRDEDGEILDLDADVKYQWQYKGEGGIWHDYEGENRQGYTPQEIDIGKYIRCKVEAVDPTKYTGTVYAGTKDGSDSGTDTPGVLVKTNKDPSVTIHPSTAAGTPTVSYPDGNTDPSDDTLFAGEGSWDYYNKTVKERKIIEVYTDSVDLNPEFDPVSMATAADTKFEQVYSYPTYASIDKNGGKYTVSGLVVDTPETVRIQYKDEENNITYCLVYQIIRRDSAARTDATVETNPTTPGGNTDHSVISAPDTSDTTKNKYVITVPNDQTSVEIKTTPVAPADFDTSYGENGIDKTGLTATMEAGSTPDAIQVKDLVVGSNGTVSVQVKSQDGSKTLIYEYEIVREDDNTSSFDVAASNPATPATPSSGVKGPEADTGSGNNHIQNIHLDSNVSSVTLTPDMKNVTIEILEKDGQVINPIPENGIYTVADIKPGEDNKVTVKYTVKDNLGVESTYTYIIDRANGADAEPEVLDPDPTTPGIPKIEETGTTTSGSETKKYITITVPANQNDLTIYPNPINNAKIDTEYNGTGYCVELKPSGVNVISGLSDTTKPYLKVTGLSKDQNTIVAIKMYSEDGKSSTIYEYTIVREGDVRITPIDKDSTENTKKITEETDTSRTTETDIYKTVTVPYETRNVELVPSLPTGAVITNLKDENGVDKTGTDIPDDGRYTITNVEYGTDKTVVYTIKMADSSIVKYHYTITKEAANSNTNITTGVQDPTPGDTSDNPVIDSSEPVKDETIDGTTQKVKDITVTVPYKNTSVTLTPEVEEITSSFDTSYGTNGIKKDSLVPGTTLADSSNVGTTDPTIKLDNLKAGTDNVISIKVKAQDGSTCIYRYTITRQTGTDVTVTPTGPDSTITSQIKGPEIDTGKTSTNTDKYYTVTLPNGTSEVTMTPTINDGDTITSVTVDGSVVTTQPNGAYTVTGVTTDQTKEIVYTVKDPDGNEVKYHYTISQDKKADTKDPSITDITVKTGDGVGTPADIKINNNGTEKTIDITVPYNTTDYTFIPETKDPGTKITEITKVSGPADVSTSADGKSFTATGLSSETPTVVRVTTESSTGDKITYTVTINRAQEGVTPTISVEMNGGSMNLQDYIPDDVRKNAKEIIYHCCAHTVLAIDKDGTVRAIGRSTTYKNSLVHIIVKGQDDLYTDYTVYIKVTGATKKEEYGTLVDYKGLNYEITGENTCRVSSWKTNYNTKKKNIVIPDTIKTNGKTYKVTAIAPGAFMRNSKIQTIKIGKNVQEIGNTSFIGLRKLTKFTVDKKNKYFKVAGKSGNLAKMILSKNGKTLYSMTNIQGTVTIPKSVTRVTEYAGAGNVKMKKLIIPASVKRIDPCAFAHANKLTYVQFKGKLPEMANNCILDQMNYKKGTVYVPKKEYTKYKTAFQSASKKRYGIQQFPSMSKLKKK